MLSPGEICRGSLVTVHQWQRDECLGHIMAPSRREYCGSVLQVVAIQLPYVTCKSASKDGGDRYSKGYADGSQQGVCCECGDHIGWSSGW